MEQTGDVQKNVVETDHSDDEVIRQRKEKLFKFFKEKYNWITYVILTFIVFISVKIRTANLPGLRDVTTGGWTLGPDLDPWLFHRWAEYIVEHGSLFAVDTMRYVPLGFNTKGELLLLPYMMAWFHKLASIFGTESFTHSAVLFPVFMFALTVIAFFFFVREIFLKDFGKNKAGIIALISSFFLSVLPPLLPRTIAGIPEKESAAFFFMFAAFYFFLVSWRAEKNIKRYSLAFLAGLATAGMALVWGGYGYIFLTLSMTILVAFLFGKVENKEFNVIVIWIISSFLLMIPFSTRYNLINLLTSIETGASVFVVLTIGIYLVMPKIKFAKSLSKKLNFPKQAISFITAFIVSFLIILVLKGPIFIMDQLTKLSNNLIKPATGRLLQTVAENRQPYFSEWAGNFGPQISGIPLFFWIFFVGSIYLFFAMLYFTKRKERYIITLSYIIFLFSLVFSRFSGNHLLNGQNFMSLLVYFLGAGIFLVTLGFYYIQYYRKGKFEDLKKSSLGFLLLFTFFVLGIISARGAVRLIMILVPPVSIIAAFFVVDISYKARKDLNIKKFGLPIASIILILLVIFSGFQFYKISGASAKSYVPSIYNQQWQLAMSWVRENTPEDAVFGHWWDYGYWLQSIGERATILDGGNAVSYWNYFMGRHALTGENNVDALEFLYAHNATHFLIDSSDIGKYAAFSSIGSNPNYDRRSWINTFVRDDGQSFETKNSTTVVFSGGSVLDSDIIYEENGEKIFLPAGKAGIVAVIMEINKETETTGNFEGVFVYQNKQYRIPLKYAHFGGELIDFGNGIEAGVYLFPRIIQSQENLQIQDNGALLFLTDRTVKSQFARLYLYKEDNPYFKLAHSEDDLIVSQLKTQTGIKEDIIYYQGIRGPIKIWKIQYPTDIKFKDEFLEKIYPAELRRV